GERVGRRRPRRQGDLAARAREHDRAAHGGDLRAGQQGGAQESLRPADRGRGRDHRRHVAAAGGRGTGRAGVRDASSHGVAARPRRAVGERVRSTLRHRGGARAPRREVGRASGGFRRGRPVQDSDGIRPSQLVRRPVLKSITPGPHGYDARGPEPGRVPMSTFELEIDRSNSARLKVIGCGGAGGNAVNRMIGAGLRGVEFIVANTDMQALAQSLAPTRVQIGVNTTRGLGSGGDPQTGRRSAEEDESAITDAVADADMVFITAGMGGGTGTGSAPVVARLARQAGALTVAVVTKPFQFEGRRRLRQADEGLAELRNEVDTLLVIPNERLLSVVDKTTALSEAFSVADNVLLQATKGISELVTVP